MCVRFAQLSLFTLSRDERIRRLRAAVGTWHNVPEHAQEGLVSAVRAHDASPSVSWESLSASPSLFLVFSLFCFLLFFLNHRVCLAADGALTALVSHAHCLAAGKRASRLFGRALRRNPLSWWKRERLSGGAPWRELAISSTKLAAAR